MKQICLNVPDSFQLPTFYSTQSETTVSIALALGAEAYETLYASVMDKVRRETSAEMIAEISKKYASQIEIVKSESETQVKKIREEKQRYEDALKSAKHQLELHEQSSASLHADAQAIAKATYGELITSKEKQIHRLEDLLERQLGTVCGKVESLQNSITKTFSSSKDKGTFGEFLIEGFLKKAYDCDVEIVSKEAQTADIRMTRSEYEYFWEAKNYTRMVSSEEVEKFRRDMRLHPKVVAGCLVSLRTGIVGHSRGGDIDIEFLEDGRCILFLSNFLNRDDPVFYLQTLRPFFEILEASARPVKEDSDIVRTLQVKGALITNLLRSHITAVAKHRNSIVTHKKRIETMFTEFQGYIMEAETQLQTILRIAIGDDDTVAVASDEASTELPPLFKKQHLSDYDTKQKEFIQWLLRTCSVEEGSVEIKQIIELTKDKFSEKWIRNLRELFQESAWSQGSRYIHGLKLLPTQ